MLSIVKTSGDFSLRDCTHGIVEIHMGVPTVVKSTYFIQERLSSGQLTLLGTVNDEATQDEMLSYLRDSGTEELAIASFLASFPVDGKPVEKVLDAPVVEKKVAAKIDVTKLP